MRLRGLAILLSCITLAACSSVSLSAPDAPRLHASLAGSHIDTSPERIDTFRVTGIDGRPIGRTDEPSKTLGVDAVNTIDAGRSVRVEFEGLARYPNPMRTFFWDSFGVEGRVEFVPVADARYVVRGAIDDTGSSVWIEDDSTHEVVGRKFIVPPKAAAAAP